MQCVSPVSPVSNTVVTVMLWVDVYSGMDGLHYHLMYYRMCMFKTNWLRYFYTQIIFPEANNNSPFILKIVLNMNNTSPNNSKMADCYSMFASIFASRASNLTTNLESGPRFAGI